MKIEISRERPFARRREVSIFNSPYSINKKYDLMKKVFLLSVVMCGLVFGAAAQNVDTVKDSVKQGWVYNPEGEDDDWYRPVDYDTDPLFPGGVEALYKFIHDNLQYPQEAKERELTGKVYVTFTIKEDGTVDNVMVLRDIGGGCGQEAVRIIKSLPKWEPGKYKNKPIAINLNVVVTFVL